MQMWILLALFVTGVVCKPTDPFHGKRNPMHNPNLYQGDILLVHGQDRNAIKYDQQRWDNGIVPYVFNDRAVLAQKNLIRQAMNHIEQKTGCIRFVERTREQHYLGLFAGDGCYSYVGCIHQGEQELSLSDGCYFFGTVVHELMHALGFDHEQNRSDRDDYLIVYWQNIQQGQEDQFQKLHPTRERILGAFEYDSIMMYGETAFSKDGSSKTMVAKDPRYRLKEPYEKAGLTALDTSKIKKLYKC